MDYSQLPHILDTSPLSRVVSSSYELHIADDLQYEVQPIHASTGQREALVCEAI